MVGVGDIARCDGNGDELTARIVDSILIAAEAVGLGWRLRAEVHVAVEYEGEVRVDDPDGIVVDARFVALDECADQLVHCHPWVREPLAEWLSARWSHVDAPGPFGYRVDGSDVASVVVTRVC